MILVMANHPRGACAEYRQGRSPTDLDLRTVAIDTVERAASQRDVELTQRIETIITSHHQRLPFNLEFKRKVRFHRPQDQVVNV